MSVEMIGGHQLRLHDVLHVLTVTPSTYRQVRIASRGAARPFIHPADL
jgi:hypothetical protein